MRTKADTKAAYSRFLDTVNQNDLVWFLLDVHEDYPAYCMSNNSERSVYPFWSDAAYARRTQIKFDFETKVDKIPLSSFISRTLPHLKDIDALIGPNWDGQLAGSEIEVEDFKSDLLRD